MRELGYLKYWSCAPGGQAMGDEGAMGVVIQALTL